MSTHLRRLSIALCAVLATATSALALDHDQLVIGTQRFDAIVISEGSEEIQFKTSQQGQVIKKPTKQMRSLVYGGMLKDGDYRNGRESQARGNYEDAAELFERLATSGTSEWERVYGVMLQGDCLEMAKKYDAAAACFQKIAGDATMFAKDDRALPRHRLWMDACYRQGVALAEANKPADAAAIADGLDSYAKLSNAANPSGAQSRAGAIRAAVAAIAGDKQAIDKFMVHVNFSSSDAPDVWFHFNIFLAGSYRKLDEAGKALDLLNQMADDEYLARNPARQAQVEVLRGSCMLETDPQAALVELLKIDLMPFGSEDQRCYARAQAGILLANQATLLKDAKTEKQQQFRTELIRVARLVLDAAANSTSNQPSRAQAKTLLDQLGPAEDAAPAPKGTDGGKTPAAPSAPAPTGEPRPAPAGAPSGAPAPAPAGQAPMGKIDP